MANGAQPVPQEEQQPAAQRPVAVIGVHGVGYCEPFATARHMASLLLGLGRLKLEPVQPELPPTQPGGQSRPWPGDQAHPSYSGCHEQLIQVPLAPAPINDPANARRRRLDDGATWFRRLVNYWDERRGYVAGVFEGHVPLAQVTADLNDRGRLAHEFMRAQLAGYISSEDGQAYDTIRLETERIPEDAAGQKKTVHIYEVYWADLARPQGSIVSFFNAVYQLLFHLGSLSRTAADYATLEHSNRHSWRWLCFWQALAVRFLVLPVPIFNLILLMAALTVLPLKADLDHGLLSAALVGLSLLVIVVRWWPKVAKHPRAWYGSLAAFSVVGFAAGYFLLTIAEPASRKLAADIALAVEWWLLGGFLLLLLMKRYETVRRGAFKTALVLYLASAATFLSLLFCRAFSFEDPVEQASFWTLQIIMGVLVICWLALLFSAVMAWVLHLVCLVQTRHSASLAERARAHAPNDAPPNQLAALQMEMETRLNQYARARAALRTSRLTLAVSASVFLLITVFLWAGAFSYTSKKLSLYKQLELNYPELPGPLTPLLSMFVPSSEDAFRWIYDRQTAAAKTHTPPKQCGELRNSDLLTLSLEKRLNEVQLALSKHGLVAPHPLKLQLLNNDVEMLEEMSRIRPERSLAGAPLDCEIRVYHLEVKSGLTTESEFSVYARTLLVAGTTSGVIIRMVLIALALGLLGCAVARSLIPGKAQLNRASNRQCAQLADWLSRGLDSTRAVTSLFWHSIFTISLIFGLLDYLYSHGRLAWIPWIGASVWLNRLISFTNDGTLRVLDLVGARLAISGAAIAALVYKYGRVPLDILLDVDSYLRTSPLENAPRARIAERYVSLLRYIASQRNVNDNTPLYGSVVIVAHSLGALISVDLLHYLKRELDPTLNELGYGVANQANPPTRIRLFTFGNPLRQLLNRFFPNLYWWVREQPDNAVDPLPRAVYVPPLISSPPPRPPNPTDLGPAVGPWVNAYRSGDFVGRLLWADDWYCRTVPPADGHYPQPIEKCCDNPNHPTKVEMCIGLGGHNDYWNRTAPDIAEVMDELIGL